MKLFNPIYAHLCALEKKACPYWDDVPRWQRAYVPLLKWLFADRLRYLRQIALLEHKLKVANKEALWVRRYLVAAASQGDVTFDEALQLVGFIEKAEAQVSV